MSRKSARYLQVGGELVHTGFANASDEFRNVVLCLEEAGLSFILEHPCRVLHRDVLEFFKTASLRRHGTVIKSTVRNTIIKMKPSRLSKLLKMPAVEEEDCLLEQDYTRSLLFCGLPRGTTSIRRKNMNGEGKLLSDILGKVLLCKVGSHDYLSNYMFKLLAGVICRKRVNWGLVLFDKIKESLMTPNFGRIISLYLNQIDGNQFDMSSGSPIHYLKKIDYTILNRWERKFVRTGLKKPDDEEEVFEDEQKFQPSPFKIALQSATVPIQGENLHVPAPAFPEEVPKVPSPLPLISSLRADQDIQGNQADPIDDEAQNAHADLGGHEEEQLNSSSLQSKIDHIISNLKRRINLIPGHSPDLLKTQIQKKVDDPSEGEQEKFSAAADDGDDDGNDDDDDDDPDHEAVQADNQPGDVVPDKEEVAQEKETLAESEVEFLKKSEILFAVHGEVVKDNIDQEDEILPAVKVREDVQYALPAQENLLNRRLPSLGEAKSDEFMFNDESLGTPSHQRVHVPTPSTSNYELLQTIEALLKSQAKHFEFSMKQVFDKVREVEADLNNGLAEVKQNLSKMKNDLDNYFLNGVEVVSYTNKGQKCVFDNTSTLIDGQDSLAQNDLRIFKEEIIQALHEEVRKGEENILSQMHDLSREIESKFHEANVYDHQSFQWLHAELTGRVAKKHPYQNIPEYLPEANQFDPPLHYSRVWSGDEEYAEPSVPPVKKRKYGERSFASNSDPSARRRPGAEKNMKSEDTLWSWS